MNDDVSADKSRQRCCATQLDHTLRRSVSRRRSTEIKRASDLRQGQDDSAQSMQPTMPRDNGPTGPRNVPLIRSPHLQSRGVQLPLTTPMSRNRDGATPGTEAHKFEMRSFSRTTVVSSPSAGGSSLSNLRASASDLAAQFLVSKRSEEDLKRTVEEQRDEISRLHNECTASVAQCAALKATLETSKEERKQLVQRIHDLGDSLDEVKRNQDRAEKVLEECRGNYDVSAGLVSGRLEDDKEFLSSLDKVTVTLKQCKSELASATQENRRLSGNLGELQSLCDEFKDQSEAAAKDCETIRHELSEAKRSLTASKEALTLKNKMMVRLQTEHKSFETNLNALHEDEVRQLTNQINETDAELSDEREKRIAAQKNMARWEADNTELQRRISNFKRDLEKKSNDHESLKRNLRTVNALLEQSKEEIAENERMIDELENKYDGLQVEKEELEATLEETKTMVTELEDTNADESRQLIDSKEMEKKHKDEIASLKLQMAMLEDKHLSECQDLERTHSASLKSLEASINARLESETEKLMRQNKEWISAKDDEHKRLVADRDAEIQTLKETLVELQLAKAALEREVSGLQRSAKLHSSLAVDVKRGTATHEDAVPTPSVAPKRRMSTLARQPKEMPEDTARKPIRASKDSDPPKKRLKGKKSRSKSKSDYKSQIRSLALAPEDDSHELQDFDPFAFTE